MPKHMMIARQWAGKIGEASYEGNLGIAELVKFSQKASKVQRQAFDSFVNKGDDRKAWALVQKVVGVKLKGKQFESDLKASTGIRWAKNLKVNESMKIKKSEWDKILKEEKRYLTESMAKTKSHEAEELYLYIENTGTLYRQLESIIENIKRKAKKGNYDHKRAPKLWRYLVDNGAKSYAKEHAGGVKDAARIFPGKVRDNVAQVFADEYLDRIKNGEFGTVGNFNEARIIAPAKDKEPVHITDSDLKDHGIKPASVKRTFLGKNGKGWQIALYQPKKNPRSKYYAIQKYKTDKGSELKTVASQPEAYKLIKGYNAMNESVQLKEASMKSDHHVVVEIKHPELPSSVADGATVVFVGSKRNADKAMKGFRKKNPKRQYIMVYTMSKIKLGQKYVRGKFKESVQLVKEFSAKAHYKKYQDKFRMGGEDLKNFSPIKGMEGPFRFKSGFILYYDPKEGKYYDRRRDVYLSNKEAQIQARV